MSFASATRCTFVVVGLSTLLDQYHCDEMVNKSRDSMWADAQMKILLLTLLGLVLLILLGFLGEF